MTQNWTQDRLDLQGWAIAETERRRARAAMDQAGRDAARCAKGAKRYLREHGPTTIEFTDGRLATTALYAFGLVLDAGSDMTGLRLGE